MTRAKAYDQARKEFYDLRLQEDVRRSVAKEEAIATGAYFGKTALDIGMELENKQFEDWKKWAEGEVVLAQQKHAAMYTGGSVDPDDVTLDKQVEQSLDGPDETVPSLG